MKRERKEAVMVVNVNAIGWANKGLFYSVELRSEMTCCIVLRRVE